MGESNPDWENSCLFALASLGDVNLFKHWLDKKINIDVEDEDGDTALHYAVRGGHIDIVIALLEAGAVISSNKKKRTALLDAYAFNQTKIANEITKVVIQRNSVKNLLQFQKSTKIDNPEQLVNNFIKYLRKKYLDRNIFTRFPAKHTRRANALITAARECISKKKFKEFDELLNNQLNLFKGVPANPISESIIHKRWSEELKNKPKDPKQSLFYKTLNTFVNIPSNLNNGSVRSVSHR